MVVGQMVFKKIPEFRGIWERRRRTVEVMLNEERLQQESWKQWEEIDGYGEGEEGISETEGEFEGK
jgi:hypothetical protein